MVDVCILNIFLFLYLFCYPWQGTGILLVRLHIYSFPNKSTICVFFHIETVFYIILVLGCPANRFFIWLDNYMTVRETKI
jgi:hypothetical protein